MKLSGSATIAHPVRDVYAALTDPAMLVRTLPGCQRLEQVGPDAYQATLEAGVGSIKGLFDGEVQLSNLTAPDSFTLHASGAGKPGTVDAVAHVRLVADPASGGTMVHYAADATVGGVIGGVGQRMLAGVARRTADEFFAAVGRELSSATVGTVSPRAVHGAGAATAEPATSAAGVAVPVSPGAPPASAVPPASAAPAGQAPLAVRAASPMSSGGAYPAAAPAGERQVWTRPTPPPDFARQRTRELLTAAALGGVIALLGVLLGAIVAGW